MISNWREWTKTILWGVVLAGGAAAVMRFAFGLGVTTGLDDATPWGLWIALKLGFVALSGGGFTLAALVYVFRLESYRPLVRRAILLALLGYGSFIVSLIFDLGLPWHIYMPILHWQHHSVMFEIAWCVVLYFSVLVLEFSPVVLEHPFFQNAVLQKALHLLHKTTPVWVIAGIVLSTLHQSSLGALFLMAPHRVHPLWYSAWIPVQFFISAISAGVMFLLLEVYLAERWFNNEARLDLMQKLAQIGKFTLGLYLIMRVGDLLWRGVLPSALDGSWQSVLFAAEILLGGVLPIVLLSLPAIRQHKETLITSAALVVGGVLSQRMALSMFTLWRPAEQPYTPALAEVLIAFAIPAAAALLYLFAMENLAVREGSTQAPRIHEALSHPQWGAYQDHSLWGVITQRSLLAVFVVALAVVLLPNQNNAMATLPKQPVQAGRGWEKLILDGNRASYQVNFAHAEHQERLDCQVCHHLNIPQDDASGCWQCHSDFSQPTTIFEHGLHQRTLQGNASCENCHAGAHNRHTAIDCQECHASTEQGERVSTFTLEAPGYVQAMHGVCLECHQRESQARGRADLAVCSTCHFIPQPAPEGQARLNQE
jgi:Ni/Fe-hydrogenase subunit HybB-like protein